MKFFIAEALLRRNLYNGCKCLPLIFSSDAMPGLCIGLAGCIVLLALVCSLDVLESMARGCTLIIIQVTEVDGVRSRGTETCGPHQSFGDVQEHAAT